MMDKFRRDIQTPKQRYPLTENVHSNDLKEYYFVFTVDRVSSGADQPLINKFDKNGIPINKTYIDVSEKEYVYFPISIGQLGLAVFHSYLNSNSDKDKNRFINFCNWFADEKNFDYSEKLGVRWLTEVPLPQYKNPGPWQSAFSQSRGQSILTRGYQLTKDENYRKIAEESLKSFEYPVSEGGVSSYTEFGPFYEEYTSSVPTLVLNGMMFALFGIYDFVRAFPDNPKSRKLFDQGVETLANILPQYNMGFWSKYNLCEAEWYPKIDPATIQYQRLHVAQLKVMKRITGNEIFDRYADIFSKQDSFLNAIKMYTVKYKALKKIGRL
ncbi:MAG TPA: hypothetical protein ENN33_00605 [Ignavibacteria bacterium]|nr:hypothetical protein [Ignavibacteria bacterium]